MHSLDDITTYIPKLRMMDGLCKVWIVNELMWVKYVEMHRQKGKDKHLELLVLPLDLSTVFLLLAKPRFENSASSYTLFM